MSALRQRSTGSAQLVSVVAMIVAGFLFVLYPLMRGFDAEDSRHGADSFAAWTWAASHVSAMAGFVLIAVALRFLRGWGAGVELTAWLAASLLLPYYGAEAFGLTAVGEWARDTREYDALAIADGFRYAAVPMATFAVGWLLLAAVGLIVIVRAIRASGAVVPRSAAAVAGACLVVFLPVFFVPGPLRITHGMILGIALITWGVGVFVAHGVRATRTAARTVDDTSVSVLGR
ncbi:hypothetical protein LK459_19900 [Gordonia otitidis]|uniref:hypothetical protein n=1 Tax=Gordonia otitidis TaxID=249058 RepID=UPI001D139CD3|nr:hypothetical protein [Gordonia otitidis]UEA58778.1 hypothetical protein LK459_19900 [Gordonia otitidis]